MMPSKVSRQFPRPNNFQIFDGQFLDEEWACAARQCRRTREHRVCNRMCDVSDLGTDPRHEQRATSYIEPTTRRDYVRVALQWITESNLLLLSRGSFKFYLSAAISRPIVLERDKPKASRGCYDRRSNSIRSKDGCFNNGQTIRQIVRYHHRILL